MLLALGCRSPLHAGVAAGCALGCSATESHPSAGYVEATPALSADAYAVQCQALDDALGCSGTLRFPSHAGQQQDVWADIPVDMGLKDWTWAARDVHCTTQFNANMPR